MDVRGRVALVTGGGRRVGRAIALSLGAAGARVVVHYNQSEGEAKDVVDQIAAGGGHAVAVGADLLDAEAPAALVAQAARQMNGLDILVNSAAMMLRTPVGEVTTGDWDRMMALNLRAPFFASQAAASVMGDGGVIVNIADLAAFETWPAYVPHGISKAGVVQMTKALARALGPRIRVNAVAPGVVLMPEGWSGESAEHLASTTPLQRIGDPADVVQAVRYLIDADFVTGETIIVDGGRHVRT